jgi:hypothetical protein
MVSPHTFSVILATIALFGCSSLSGPPQETDQWKADWKGRAARWAGGASRGASAVGSSLGTAVQGVRTGFEDPDAEGFGPYPRDYREAIRSHLLRFESISADASIRFGRPEKGYITQGILRGGAVVWQGYLVDVEIEHRSKIASQSRTRGYVVRLREGEVIEVHNERQTAALRRVPPSVPAKRAPQGD